MKLQNLILTLCIGLSSFSLNAQTYKASLHEDFTIKIDTLASTTQAFTSGGGFQQLSGFPKGGIANPTFKNFRNVTLADLNNDGLDDILLASNNKLFAYSHDQLLWEKTLQGTAIYPPSVADIDNDGQPEIVQTTGGVPSNGRIYLLDRNGNDLAGWPLSFNNNWILSAAALADVNEDKILEIIVSERIPPAGRVHVLQLNGQELNNNWPVTLGATPAITPSVGDLDNDGEVEIVVHSTEGRYVLNLNGEAKSGFPQITHPDQRYSFQSPILVDLDDDNTLEIVGNTHGDQPEFYVLHADGNNKTGWPQSVPENNWTFNPPTVVKIQGEYWIINSRPIGEEAKDMLYAWDIDGNQRSGFPIVKPGGLEGFISVADIDNDGGFEILFGSNLLDENGFGFIHAYEMDGTGEVPGFPIRPKGWTFMNGANVGDINGDEKMDLSVLSYTQNFGADTDSVFLNVYDLEVPYSSEKILWSTYKGHNTRNGLISSSPNVGTMNLSQSSFSLSLYPNPAGQMLNWNIESPGWQNARIEIYNSLGQKLDGRELKSIPQGLFQSTIELGHLKTGIYWLKLSVAGQSVISKSFSVQ